MKEKGAGILFFQSLLFLTGVGVFIFLLWGPHIEGRNVGANLFHIYFQDPFLAYVYFASAFFFAGLYRVLCILGYVKQGRWKDAQVVKDLIRVRWCAKILMIFIFFAEVFLFLQESDDRAGGVFIGAIVFFGSLIVWLLARVFENKWRSNV